MELKVLHQHGWSLSALAREFGLNWRTVKREVDQPRPAALSGAGEAHRPHRGPARATSSGGWRSAPGSGAPTCTGS